MEQEREKMTKKDYDLIAQTIGNTWCDFEAQKIISENLATALMGTNPLFDRERFLVVCGVIPATEKKGKK
jgi:hypothetical protein